MSRPEDDPGRIAAVLAFGRPLIGLDLGSKTIGVAVSDALLGVASPLETLKRGKFSAMAARLGEIAAHRNAGGFVIGLPVNMDGSEGPAAQSARAFGRQLARALDLPVAYWDERLSTVAVERTLLEADASRKRRGEVVDRMAAAFILQGALERIRHVRAAQAEEGDEDDDENGPR